MAYTFEKPSNICPECGQGASDGLLIFDVSKLYKIHEGCKESYINRRIAEAPYLEVNRNPSWHDSQYILSHVY